MSASQRRQPALAYLRTSSAANVDGDSSERQRVAIRAYADRAGLEIVAEHYDAAVSGADPLDRRKGFAALLADAREHGIKVVVVETASRFARDLIVQETGHAMMRRLGLCLIASDDPDAFTADTPTARMVRQILGAVSEFEKAALVAKLAGARDRASEKAGRRVEGRKATITPEIVATIRRLHRKSPKTGERRSLREIAAELAKAGHVNPASGKPYSAEAIRLVLAARKEATPAA
jgi:DNA invertase Pin-like site-specific DNA recombinase